MKTIIACLLVATCAAGAALAAEPATAPSAPLSAEQRIDALIQQNQALVEQVKRLATEADRPKTREEAFASCMQAARGQSSAMAAESIGSHCDQLLKK